MLEKFKELFKVHFYTFTEKQLKSILVEIDEEYKNEYEDKYKNNLAELQKNITTQRSYISKLEKDITNLVIKNDVIKNKLRELEDEGIAAKENNPLFKEIFKDNEK
jgi:septal ring factor EnvC (AmiA/AmiB activator)